MDIEPRARLLPVQRPARTSAPTPEAPSDSVGTGVYTTPMSSTILQQPWVRFGRETCGDIDEAVRREWLVTNDRGGYAAGTVAGVNTRSYHGLLVAALDPPGGRVVLVSGSVGWMTTGDRRVPLTSHEFGDGVIAPEGYRHMVSFHLEGTLPVWRFAYRDVLIERRLWMAPDANTTYLCYELLRGAPISVDIIPLLTYRDPNMLTSGLDWQMDVDVRAEGTDTTDAGGTLQPSGAGPVRMSIDRGEFRPGGEWYWNFQHRAETARGHADRGDCYAPGSFVATLEVGQAATLTYSAEEGADHDPAADLATVQGRQRILVGRLPKAPPLIQHLSLAADQCFARRGEGWTVLAGSPWFLDWGRDTMVALPGLTAATGRTEDAASVLRTAAAAVQDGLVPNVFGSAEGEPLFNTADASLWFVRALDHHAEATGDVELFAELAPVVREIVERYTAGTRFGIGVDPEDGLLRAGEPGVQLTWMDAKVDEWVVTPRIGKPVELNVLWYAALRTAQRRFGAAVDGETDSRIVGETSAPSVVSSPSLAMSSDVETSPPSASPTTGSPEPTTNAGERPVPSRGSTPDPSDGADASGSAPRPTSDPDPRTLDFSDAAFADRCAAAADRLRASFQGRFVSPDRPWLADVVDGPDGDDWSHRPNQVLAISLVDDLVDGEIADRMLVAVARSLVTSMGLRTLSRDNAAYRGIYGGDRRIRDGAYHQGTVWPWLLGPYLEALWRRTGDRDLVLSYLEPFADHLREHGLGTVAEIADGDPPHRPNGATSQAWSIAELVRIWRLVGEGDEGTGLTADSASVSTRGRT